MLWVCGTSSPWLDRHWAWPSDLEGPLGTLLSTTVTSPLVWLGLFCIIMRAMGFSLPFLLGQFFLIWATLSWYKQHGAWSSVLQVLFAMMRVPWRDCLLWFGQDNLAGPLLDSRPPWGLETMLFALFALRWSPWGVAPALARHSNQDKENQHDPWPGSKALFLLFEIQHWHWSSSPPTLKRPLFSRWSLSPPQHPSPSPPPPHCMASAALAPAQPLSAVGEPHRNGSRVQRCFSLAGSTIGFKDTAVKPGELHGSWWSLGGRHLQRATFHCCSSLLWKVFL